ncbi:MAG: hypothetical protein ACXVHW_08690, partial [Methanobacterium sp.]
GVKSILDKNNNNITKIAIACQGGGSHTAFTAGVLKRLLREEEKKFSKWGEEVRNDPARSPFIGPSSSYAIEKLNSGISWKESGSDIPQL